MVNNRKKPPGKVQPKKNLRSADNVENDNKNTRKSSSKSSEPGKSTTTKRAKIDNMKKKEEVSSSELYSDSDSSSDFEQVPEKNSKLEIIEKKEVKTSTAKKKTIITQQLKKAKRDDSNENATTSNHDYKSPPLLKKEMKAKVTSPSRVRLPANLTNKKIEPKIKKVKNESKPSSPQKSASINDPLASIKELLFQERINKYNSEVNNGESSKSINRASDSSNENSNKDNFMSSDDDDDSENESSGWEDVIDEVIEVEDVELPVEKYQIPAGGVQFTIEKEQSLLKKRKGLDMHGYLRRELNRRIREVQESLHKVSLLCLMSRGIYINSILCNEENLAITLSIIPTKQMHPPKNVNLNYLEKFIRWFRASYKLDPTFVPTTSSSSISESDDKNQYSAILMAQLQSCKVVNHENMVQVFVIILRSFGILTRFVWSLQPLSRKPKSEDLFRDPDTRRKKMGENNNVEIDDKTGSKIITIDSSENEAADVDNKPTTSKKANKKIESKKKKGETEEKSNTRKTNINDSANSKSAKAKAKKNEPPAKKSNSSENEDSEDEFIPEPMSDDSDFLPESPKKKKRKFTPTITFKNSLKDKITTANKDNKPKGQNKKDNDNSDSRSTTSKYFKSEEDKIENFTIKKSQSLKKGKEYVNVWPECYLDEEQRWISVDLTEGLIMCDNKLEEKAESPFAYVLAFNNDGKIKDVTRRYASNWLTYTQKIRIDADWWLDTLEPFLQAQNWRESQEDEFLDQHLLNLPKPKSIQEYKGHPLYVLKRHLLKFEALYPTEALILGFIRNEPIYSRDCVKTLHSREIWNREAKVVRVGEKPYKIVKSRPKYDKIKREAIPGGALELFGDWQVDDFIPPTAKNGKVPRNEYGNVELFKERMLPKGTVHLNVPGLNRVAKKLDIDCAPAVTGFEFTGHGCHPTFEGFIVCEEFKDIIMDAWSQEQDEQEKKNEEKRLKRILENWKKLVKGVIIRERVAVKYGFKTARNEKRKFEDDNDDESSSEDEQVINKVSAKVITKNQPRKK